LNDGRVGFIDFGIVGRVGEKTFKAVNDLSMALALGDYRAMAQALCSMGATDETVDIDKFGRDLEKITRRMMDVQPDILVAEMTDGTLAGSMNIDESEITNLLLELVDVTEDNGLKLPREFGLLVKQSLYFDRYLKILAPDLDVMRDVRVNGLGDADGGELKQINGSRVDPEKVVVDV
jgi:aarF domain-containing kinase